MDEQKESKEKLLPKRRPWPLMVKIGLVLLSVYVLLSLSIPAVNFLFPTAIRHLVFMNIINTPGNLTHPETFGLDRVSHFYLDVEPGVRLGIWHFRLPLIADAPFTNDEEYFQKHLTATASNIPLILYLHGNAFDRSVAHRRELCRRFRDELKYDVIAFDYRGFGDSTGEATEAGLVKDAEFLYQWLETRTNARRRIYLWGHSLGSAVAVQVAAQLSAAPSRTLGGLVLEAPFLDIHQALLTHWLSLFFRWQPWYYGMAEKGLLRNKLAFVTRTYLGKLNCPTVLLHADDDLTVPYIHSKQLLKTAMAARDQHRQEKKFFRFQIDMISFHHAGYGHRLIHQAPKLLSALKHVTFEEDL